MALEVGVVWTRVGREERALGDAAIGAGVREGRGGH